MHIKEQLQDHQKGIKQTTDQPTTDPRVQHINTVEKPARKNAGGGAAVFMSIGNFMTIFRKFLSVACICFIFAIGLISGLPLISFLFSFFFYFYDSTLTVFNQVYISTVVSCGMLHCHLWPEARKSATCFNFSLNFNDIEIGISSTNDHQPKVIKSMSNSRYTLQFQFKKLKENVLYLHL